MAEINIKLVKSLIGRSDRQIKTAASLGLKKIGDESSHEEGAVLDGKLKIIAHMVCVTNADAAASAGASRQLK